MYCALTSPRRVLFLYRRRVLAIGLPVRATIGRGKRGLRGGGGSLEPQKEGGGGSFEPQKEGGGAFEPQKEGGGGRLSPRRRGGGAFEPQKEGGGV